MNNNLLPKRALITGASGYIGANVAKHFVRQGSDVHIIIRPDSNLKLLDAVSNNINVHRHDGSDQGLIKIIKKAKPDVVFHIASFFIAQHKTEDISELINSNLIFSTQLIEAMILNGVKHLINTGTSWQHYENEHYNPTNLYAATKQAFEDILKYYIEAHGLIAQTLVLFDTYGDGDPRGKLISILCKAAKTQTTLQMSKGEQFIDLVHINDVVNAFAVASRSVTSQKNGHERYGVASGSPITLRELVKIFEQTNSVKIPIAWGYKPYRNREVFSTWKTYSTLPNWNPTVKLEEGLATIYNSFEKTQ